MADGAAFVAGAIEAFPYRVHTVPNDDRVCRADGIKHRLTKPYRPWANGQAERTVRAPKGATVRSSHHETRADLEARPRAYVAAHNLGRHLEGLRWRTPSQAVCDDWKKDPTRFEVDPHHRIARPYT